MSILLEALRKSEKNQRLHEAPTIHSDDQPVAVSEPLPTGLLVILLLTGLFVSGWFVWRQYQPPAGGYESPVTLPAEKVFVGSKPEVQEQESAQLASASPSADVSDGQQRTPVESYEPAIDNSAPSLWDPQESPADERENAAGADSINDQPDPDATMVVRSDSSSSNTMTGGNPAETDEKQFHPGEPAPIGYWELPDSVRADVPEIKFTVLVYATDPADRFVLINGQRLREGDSTQPGLVVKEIRRDGVVFSYRLYQFLVER